MPDNTGPDERPSPESITQTLAEVARIINDEQPDIVLLQEIDDGAKRTDYEDQLARLLPLLNDTYPCHSSTFYWKAAYLPGNHINGAVGMKLVTLSKYRISEAKRYQLALVPHNIIVQQFNLKRAIVETRLPVEQSKDVVMLNTHLEAFAQGTNTMEQQVAQVQERLEHLTQEDVAWVIGGDFNLLPPSAQPQSVLTPLYENYQAVPSLDSLEGPNKEQWFTHFPNNPAFEAPDKTIDYLFLSPLIPLKQSYVRQNDTLDISDHLPVVVVIDLPY